jgi:hypothetical protein
MCAHAVQCNRQCVHAIRSAEVKSLTLLQSMTTSPLPLGTVSEGCSPSAGISASSVPGATCSVRTYTHTYIHTYTTYICVRILA